MRKLVQAPLALTKTMICLIIAAGISFFFFFEHLCGLVLEILK